MTTTRRELFRLGLGGSTLLACGTTVPTFLARSALALADGPKREAGGPILVVIQLDGGNDGLNTVVPHGDDIYHKKQAQARVEGQRPEADRRARWPASRRSMGSRSSARTAGWRSCSRSAIPTRTARTSSRWPSGRRRGSIRARKNLAGWPGPIDLGHAGAGRRRTGSAHRRRGACRRPCAGGSTSFLRWRPPTHFAGAWVCPSPTGPLDQRHARPDRGPARRTARTRCSSSCRGTPSISYASSARLDAVFRDREGADDADSYALTRRLRMIARMIKAGLSTSIYYTQLGGFDTHAEQLNQHSARLNRAKPLGPFVPGRDRPIRRWRPRGGADLLRVRPPPARERQRRNRPRHGGAGVPDRPSRPRRLARTVPRPRPSEGRRPPARDRLPPNLRDSPGSVAEAARRCHARNSV